MSGVRSARRVLDISELLSQELDGLTFTEFLRYLCLPKSSLHALLRTLSARGWVVLDETTRRCHVGVRAWGSGQAFPSGEGLASIADRHLRAAGDELNETVQLAILDGVHNVYVGKVEADDALRLVSRIGSRLPAYATALGKVLLSGLSPDELARRLKRVTMHRFALATVATRIALRRQLDDIGRIGYGTDDGEYTEGFFCVATAVRDRSGAVVAAMSCSVPKVRLGPDRQEEMRDVLLEHSARLSLELGWRDRDSLSKSVI